MDENIIHKKLEMYAMITAIENDFIKSFDCLEIDDIPSIILNKAKEKIKDDNLNKLLHGLDIQSYIEVCNANIIKLKISIEEKEFLNNQLVKIIPIRNKVMHPRPLDFYDYPMLKECFNSIDTHIRFIKWNDVIETRKLIKEDPNKLIELKYSMQKSNNIIENLPSFADYEETSFIGRSKECGEIKSMLYKSNVHILSIIGDGGVGKTALALKILYDILDSDYPSFELIIWTSLKTTELNKYEFKQIENSVSSIAMMYEKLNNFIGTKKGYSTEEYLIEICKEFKTLLVLDNLETINTDDIKKFLDAFSENGKVLITSRIGLGEMEHRYPLKGMNEKDLIEYFDALLMLYGFVGFYTNEEKLDIAKNALHSNPLSIKWFVRGLYNGGKTQELLNNKTDLINFCMSNVYNKLSIKAQSILSVLSVSNCDLTYAELMYYLDKGLEDEIAIREAINELIKCNYINYEKFSNDFILSVTDFAKEFLKLNCLQNSQMVTQFSIKQKKLYSFMQNMLTKKNVNPYSMRAFVFINNDISRVIAAHYLYTALDYSNKKDYVSAFNLIDFAKKLAPKYFECNKIAAFLYATTNPLKAKEEYELALSFCETEQESATVLVLYAGFLLRINDYQGSLVQLEEAEKIDTQNIYIKFEKSKILTCMGKFYESEEILNQIQSEDLHTIKEKNIWLTRKADNLKRQSDSFEQRDYEKKFMLIKKAYLILEQSDQPDDKIYDYMTELLYNLCYMHFDTEVMAYLGSKLQKYNTNLRRMSRYKRLQELLRVKIDKILNDDIRAQLVKFTININTFLKDLKDDEGIVFSLYGNYGFIRNEQYMQGIYFKIDYKARNIKWGDIVRMENIIKTDKGPIAQGLTTLRNIGDMEREK